MEVLVESKVTGLPEVMVTEVMAVVVPDKA